MSTERTVFLVTGNCGEFDNAREWSVRVFEDRDDADALVAKLRAWCDERGLWHERLLRSGYSVWENLCPKPAEDPWFDTDSDTGTRYTVTEVPFTAANKGSAP